jgi:hypothetical protein
VVASAREHAIVGPPVEERMVTKERKDELGYKIAMILFIVLIPALFFFAVWLSPRG